MSPVVGLTHMTGTLVIPPDGLLAATMRSVPGTIPVAALVVRTAKPQCRAEVLVSNSSPVTNALFSTAE
jgi:hypothetical protein